MKALDLTVGDLVDIAIDGARFEGVENSDMHFLMSNGTTVRVELTNDPGVNIVRLGPVGWPPRPEDLWRRDDGALFFGTARGSNTVLVDRFDGDLEPQDAYEIRHRLTLAHREQQDGGDGR